MYVCMYVCMYMYTMQSNAKVKLSQSPSLLISGSSAENIKNLPLALRAREKLPGGLVGKTSRKSH